MISQAVLFLALSVSSALDDDSLATVAEKSGYKATARYADVVALGERLARTSPLVQLGELGRTVEGRSIPLWVVADPPVKNARQAKESGKLVVLLFANIHAGEVCGKEAIPMLVRELIAAPGHPLLKDLVIAMVPIYNADGNERVSKTNRPGQVGPDEGMGQRANAQGLDLNRDYMKLEAPESRALVRFFSEWDPAVVVDAHTTNGSLHRYTITYDGAKHPAGDRRVVDLSLKAMLPEVGRAFEARTGLHAFFYGNFERNHTRWTTFPPLPRYGTNYVGLRNRLSILSEAYAYAPYKTRVLATLDYLLACLEYSKAHRAEIERELGAAREATIAAGKAPKPDDLVPIRTSAHLFAEPATVLGYDERAKGGDHPPSGVPKDYRVEIERDFRPSSTVRRPFAYLIPPARKAVVENLQAHGIALSALRQDAELEVEVYRVASLSPAGVSEGHKTLAVGVDSRRETRRIPAGTVVVPTGQALGTLAVYLLEPYSDDGLFTWNFFDDALTVGADAPVGRLTNPVTLPIEPIPSKPGG